MEVAGLTLGPGGGNGRSETNDLVRGRLGPSHDNAGCLAGLRPATVAPRMAIEEVLLSGAIGALTSGPVSYWFGKRQRQQQAIEADEREGARAALETLRSMSKHLGHGRQQTEPLAAASQWSRTRLDQISLIRNAELARRSDALHETLMLAVLTREDESPYALQVAAADVELALRALLRGEEAPPAVMPSSEVILSICRTEDERVSLRPLNQWLHEGGREPAN